MERHTGNVEAQRFGYSKKMRGIRDRTSKLLGKSADGCLIVCGESKEKLQIFVAGQTRDFVELVFSIEYGHLNIVSDGEFQHMFHF
jgi:hypothetical protein